MGVRLPVRGTRVRALVWEDPACRGATKPVSQLLSLRVWSLCSARREAAIVRGPRTAMKSGLCSPQLEKKPSHRNEDPTQPKINKLINKKRKLRNVEIVMVTTRGTLKLMLDELQHGALGCVRHQDQGS